uniref:Uncharacterized protein n=1 Tax=Ixodes ricinus TaxID=34613 RepID=A0A131Y7R1_IXORI
MSGRSKVLSISPREKSDVSNAESQNHQNANKTKEYAQKIVASNGMLEQVSASSLFITEALCRIPDKLPLPQRSLPDYHFHVSILLQCEICG